MANDVSPVGSDSSAFSSLTDALKRSLDSLETRSLILFGGKGGVGKTTISALAAIHFSSRRPVILFTSDPASNLGDLLEEGIGSGSLRIEQLDAAALYEKYLGRNLESFLELADRGTYLDRDEVQRLLELSLPGIDELMAWMHAGDLVNANPDALIIVDTAPTGHTLRMLSSSGHFERFGRALEAMQDKHRELVEQLTRRRMRDAIDEFVESFRADAASREALMRDSARMAFVAVTLAEPWVVAQTVRLIDEVRESGIDAPMAVLNQAVHGCDCSRCKQKLAQERGAIGALAPMEVVLAPRSCTPLDSTSRLESWLDGATGTRETSAAEGLATVGQPLALDASLRVIFFAGKGGVGKTTSASSIALQLAAANPAGSYRLVSVDPAHSVADVFRNENPPSNLVVETIDTKKEWELLRANLGQEIERAIERLTSSGLSLSHDTNVMNRLIEMAPPGADEIFAIIRLHELLFEEQHELVIVDTAPTGHFLRLIDLPDTAGEWVREFMRILLHYRELIPPSSLGEQLVRASRGLSRFHALLRTSECGVVVVTRPERLVAAETRRLIGELGSRGIPIQGLVANYVTPESDCQCDRIRRSFQLEILGSFNKPMTIVEQKEQPVTALEELARLVPLVYD